MLFKSRRILSFLVKVSFTLTIHKKQTAPSTKRLRQAGIVLVCIRSSELSYNLCILSCLTLYLSGLEALLGLVPNAKLFAFSCALDDTKMYNVIILLLLVGVGQQCE